MELVKRPDSEIDGREANEDNGNSKTHDKLKRGSMRFRISGGRLPWVEIGYTDMRHKWSLVPQCLSMAWRCHYGVPLISHKVTPKDSCIR